MTTTTVDAPALRTATRELLAEMVAMWDTLEEGSPRKVAMLHSMDSAHEALGDAWSDVDGEWIESEE